MDLQDGAYHALQDEGDEGVFRLEPDAVIHAPKRRPIVLDTKWKVLTREIGSSASSKAMSIKCSPTRRRRMLVG